MSYDASVTIGISIKDGPLAVQEKRTISNITAANARRIAFKNESSKLKPYAKNLSSDNEDHKAICRQVIFGLDKFPMPANSRPEEQELDGARQPKVAEQLAFVAIKASKYVYKRCVNVDAGGVGFRLVGCGDVKPLAGECSKIEWMTSDRVLLNICGALDSATGIEVFVDEKLFDCSKKDEDVVVVTITYGVTGSDSGSDGAVDCCNQASGVVDSVLGRNSRQLAQR